jgi:PIN domain nuclease of toxin-antitoxin system
MRYLLDTNIFIYAAIDRDSLSRDVKAILDDYDNTFYMSSESVKELIVGFNSGKLVSRFWDTAAKDGEGHHQPLFHPHPPRG